MKVYCRNCTWYRDTVNIGSAFSGIVLREVCGANIYTRTIPGTWKDPPREEVVDMKRCEEVNANNDCPNFRNRDTAETACSLYYHEATKHSDRTDPQDLT